MKVDGAEVVLIWDDGRRTKLGTINITADSEINPRMRHIRQRIGWEFVRKGFRIMFPWRKWYESTESGEAG